MTFVSEHIYRAAKTGSNLGSMACRRPASSTGRLPELNPLFISVSIMATIVY